MKIIRFPSVYTILFMLTVFIAVMTWLIPAGSYEMVKDETLNKMVPVAGTYHAIEASPQGLSDVLLAPINGFYDPATNDARAIDVALFVLVIGGFLAVINKTGAINTAIAGAVRRLNGREIWMIPILMALFAIGGTTYGMAEETIAFYALIIPVMIAAGYDTITGVAIIMIGAGIGCLGSTINPFATVIASNAAGISFTDGMGLRFVILGLGWLICVVYVMRYASKVRRDPQQSLVAEMKAINESHFLKDYDDSPDPRLSGQQKLVLVVFFGCFAVMLWGVFAAGWWMAEFSALFLGAVILVGFIARMKESELTTTFVEGARELLGVAFIIALARGLVVLMDNGNMTHTLLHWSEILVEGLSPVAFINAIYWVQALLSLLIPSSSGLAVMTMPIMAPLADFAGVGRELVVTAYQCASGLPNLINPTSAIVMGGLALGRVSYSRWLTFMAPLLAMLILMIMLLLSLQVSMT